MTSSRSIRRSVTASCNRARRSRHSSVTAGAAGAVPA
jgi:hypothetical protein